MNLPGTRQSLVLGVAAQVALAIALASAVVFAAIYSEVRHSTRALAQAAIDADLAGLVEADAAEGPAGLSRRIADRLAFSPGAGDKPYYRLEDSARRVLAGNLPAWPDARPEVSPAGQLRLGDGATVQYRATLLRGGYRLLAGRAVNGAEAWLARLAGLFAAALVAMAALAFAIGRAAGARLNARLAAIGVVLGAFGREGAPAAAPVADPGDEIDGLTAQINSLLERTRHLLAARQELSNIIAHETRNPLMHVSARIARARAQGLTGEVDQQLAAAQDSIRQLQRMLDALLDIAASEAQRGEMNSLPELDLAELARRLVELYQPSAEDLGLRLEAEIAPQVPMRGEPVQMSSLIGNLLDNAFKYGAGGGWIRIAVAPGPVIVVEDRGPGIDPALREGIFERFRRAARGGASPAGHGLGLALVRAVAERHGLTARVEDGPGDEGGRGARFVIA
ncbi:MAG: HAMP domain-containing histidine kinase [Proteobacteria bacterium]|nr:HAMP domain-containing histidine kinase [Pseudomonadota bacterium]